MNEILIQVDVDSTLYDANELFYRVGTEEFGIEWPEIYYNWFSAEDIGTNLQTLKNVFKRCHSREYVLKNEPYSDAVVVLSELAENHDDIEIAYVSDRNEQQTAALREWLEQEGFLYSGDEYVAATKDKREWMRENRPAIVIDDRIRTILLARYELDAYVASLICPHNMNLINEAEGIYMVNDWTEMGTVLNDVIIPQIKTEVKV